MFKVPEYLVQVRRIPRGRFVHAVFDLDGTLSLLRRGWEEVMGRFMEETVWPDGPPPAELRDAIGRYIEKSSGARTIDQMEHLVDLARRYGRVPEGQLLDANGYLLEYRKQLMDCVNERVVRLKRIVDGKLSPEEFLVRGAVNFLQLLHGRGLTLHLFSGTDLEDTRREAQLLGLAHFFTDIRGVTGPHPDYNKRKALHALMEAHGLEGGQVLVVGDGPLEMRIATEYACVALGVSCDESAGRAWDMAKRRRLVEAGADLLVPDFSRASVLDAFLFNELPDF